MRIDKNNRTVQFYLAMKQAIGALVAGYGVTPLSGVVGKVLLHGDGRVPGQVEVSVNPQEFLQSEWPTLLARALR